jgi:hypothetical protein
MSDDTEQVKLGRIVDLRLPLHWLLGLVGTGLFVLIGMWFSLNQLAAEVQTLKASSKR